MECKSLAYPLAKQPGQDEISYYQWTMRIVEHKGNGDAIKPSSNITVKSVEKATESDLCDMFQASLDKFKRHLYNIRKQYRVYLSVRENLKPNECLVHVDFSENYNCSYSSEIQAVHFGGSHQQVTLHTGVFYIQ